MVTPLQRQAEQVKRLQIWLARSISARLDLKDKARARLGYELHVRYLATSS